MSRSGGLNKRKLQAQLEEARLFAERGEWAAVATALRPVLDAQADELSALSLMGEALRQLNQRSEARAVLERALALAPKDPELETRLGSLLLDGGDVAGALGLLERAARKRPRDPQVLTAHAAALVQARRFAEAEAQLARALLVGGGLDCKLVLASAKVRRGALDEADALAAQVESASREPVLSHAARSVRALVRLLRGEAAAALAGWEAVDAAGYLEPGQLSFVAYAAQLSGDPAKADALMARRLASGPDDDDLLLFAQIANLRGEPARALERLAQVRSTDTQGSFELALTRGRALRLLGRADEARAALEAARGAPEAAIPHFGASLAIDLGHLAAEAGNFEEADAHFRRALELDPDEPEARRALALTQRRLAWRVALETSAEERVDAARAEAEALRRRFLARESEVEGLRQQLARLEAERAGVEAQARQAAAEAAAERRRLEAEQRARVREELEAREKDIEGKTEENLALVLGAAKAQCPPQLLSLLQVAERTYQKALYTELPAAAVAVLYSGAFERSLVELLVKPFDAWLERQGARATFLEGGVRERRGARVDYFDRFFEAFDRELEARPPSLGEMSRVLERRGEKYLAPFARFLAERFALDDAFWGEFATFVTWAKETLRDPVAHGHLELDWEGLKRFRERLLFTFAGDRPGALPRLLAALQP